MYPSTPYLAGADSTAVKAGLPVLSVASDSLVLRAVAAAAWTGRAHAVVAPREVDTHAVVPASVCLQAALINIWKTEAGHRKLKSGLSGEKGTSGHFSWTHARVSIFVRTLIECMHRQPLPLQPNPNFNLDACDNQPKCHTKRPHFASEICILECTAQKNTHQSFSGKDYVRNKHSGAL